MCIQRIWTRRVFFLLFTLVVAMCLYKKSGRGKLNLLMTERYAMLYQYFRYGINIQTKQVNRFVRLFLAKLNFS